MLFTWRQRELSSWEVVLVFSQSSITKLNSEDIIDYPYSSHDNVIKWKYFSRYWPIVRGIHRSPKLVTRNFDVFFLTNGWANNRDAGDLSYPARYDVRVIFTLLPDASDLEKQFQCVIKL